MKSQNPWHLCYARHSYISSPERRRLRQVMAKNNSYSLNTLFAWYFSCCWCCWLHSTFTPLIRAKSGSGWNTPVNQDTHIHSSTGTQLDNFSLKSKYIEGKNSFSFHFLFLLMKIPRKKYNCIWSKNLVNRWINSLNSKKQKRMYLYFPT